MTRARRHTTLAHLLGLSLLVLLWGPNLHGDIARELGPLTTVTSTTTAISYNPTVITIGSFLYLYVQGGAPGAAPCLGDSIIAYRATLNAQGQPGTFTQVGRVSPCFPVPGGQVDFHIGPGQIFAATVDGQFGYHLLADVSDAQSFKHVWWGQTPDGINWTWHVSEEIATNQVENLADPVAHTVTSVAEPHSFIETDLPNLQLLNPITLATAQGQNGARWWGFHNFVHNGVFKVGRFYVDWDGATPTIFYVTNVDQNNQYSFTTLVDGEVDFIPWAFIERASVKSLLHDQMPGGPQRLWGSQDALWSNESVNCDTSIVAQCTTMGQCAGGIVGCRTPMGGCVPFGEFANVYNANTMATNLGHGLVWWNVFGLFDFDPEQHLVISDTRPMPTGYLTGTFHPARWNASDGTRYLFSATNDANICTRFLFSQFLLTQIVQSRVKHLEDIFEDGVEAGDTAAWSATCPPDCQPEPPE